MRHAIITLSIIAACSATLGAAEVAPVPGGTPPGPPTGSTVTPHPGTVPGGATVSPPLGSTPPAGGTTATGAGGTATGAAGGGTATGAAIPLGRPEDGPVIIDMRDQGGAAKDGRTKDGGAKDGDKPSGTGGR